MTLDRYNKIVIGLVGTIILLALLALGVFLGIESVGRHDAGGIAIDHGDQPKPKQSLMTCLPVSVVGSVFEYFAVAAVVAKDSDARPVISSLAVVSSGYEDGFSERCHFGEYGGNGHIFNVVIKNQKTGDERLLLKNAAQVVSLVRPDQECADGKGEMPCGMLLWIVRTEDTNKDGVIDYHDADAQFVSDLAVTNLVRTTPANSTLLETRWVPSRNKLISQIRHDVNADGRFTAEDGSELVEVDVTNPGVAVPALQTDTINRLAAALK